MGFGIVHLFEFFLLIGNALAIISERRVLNLGNPLTMNNHTRE